MTCQVTNVQHNPDLEILGQASAVFLCLMIRKYNTQTIMESAWLSNTNSLSVELHDSMEHISGGFMIFVPKDKLANLHFVSLTRHVFSPLFKKVRDSFQETKLSIYFWDDGWEACSV